MLFLILVVLCGALWTLAIRDDDPSTGWMSLALIASVCTLIVGAVAGSAQISFDANMRQLQQTREAVLTVDCRSYSASQIFGRALEWNQSIAADKMWNGRWYADPFIPDGIDTVSLVVLPRCAP